MRYLSDSAVVEDASWRSVDDLGYDQLETKYLKPIVYNVRFTTAKRALYAQQGQFSDCTYLWPERRFKIGPLCAASIGLNGW